MPPTPYTLFVADKDTVLEEAMDNLKEAGQLIRATKSLMRSEGMTDGEDYRDLLTRLSTALAMTEAAYLEARRRREL
jgi:predicted RNase H-like HicB family nuclease